jgi:hypothetical protein
LSAAGQSGKEQAMTTNWKCWDDEEVMERAFRAYFRAGRREGYLDSQINQPANYSCVQWHDGRDYAVLRNGNGILAVYRMKADGSLRGVDRWPKALEDF